MTIISAVLFGSQVSGGSDRQSDKDLLVICNSKNKKDAIKTYSSLGYNVSVYTPYQLESMRLQGSLFLQHLKHESQVLYDSGDTFKALIAKCDLIPPSFEEMERSRKSLLNALSSPNSYVASWWLADYLFVLSRDYFIKYFARKRRVLFNVVQLTREIEQEFNLGKIEAETFLALRKCKSIYRSGIATGSQVDQILLKWHDILIRILGIPPVVRLSSKSYLFDRAIDGFESNYELLRYIESLRIMFPNVKCGKKHEAHVMRMILNPNHYSSTSVRGKKFLSLYLMQFREAANKRVNTDCQKRPGFRFALKEKGPDPFIFQRPRVKGVRPLLSLQLIRRPVSRLIGLG
ncbi:hypothetical protein OOT00_14715 [Desulfobotulus sp. H1]|uniref:Polymerase nucleotidyl transferase domain-containing protein n=1 Tax=Desulfobotulus pelophilus TaxID=2823377 RepID=A0ABT3NCR6_9BACT|nr:hypothetical protein [Desulfobotulus pelophilus]MCW7755238.1 hypothetical protein [Desulfobotulus pelophilus]